MKKNNILPTIDLQNSREYSGAYNSRDFYKGTSFKMAGEWITNTHYFNDEYIVDFVSFEGALLSCIRSHTSSSLNMPELVRENDKIIGIKPNLFWAFVMAGVEGPTGKVWVPEINNGILSWKESNTPPSSTSISDLKGPAGDTPIIGIKKDTSNNHYYWTVSINEKTEWIFDDSGQRVLAEGLTGATGAPGIPGEDGEDGITPQLKIEDGYWFVSYDKNDPPKSWIKLGQAKGDKGDKGNTGATGAQGPQGPKGDSGRTPALVRKFGDPDNLTDDRILWGYLGDPTSEWVTLCYLEELRGDSIKSVNISDAEGHLELTMESSKVITSTGSVLPRFNAGTIETVEWDQNPSLVIDKTNAPREWALNVKVPKGKPAIVTVVSEVEKLAPDAQPYVTDLNPDISDANLKFGIPQGEKGDPGDENIAIGCQSDFPNNEPEHDKIWYDPCDESMDEYSVQDFLYNSYIAVGGTLTQEQFETAWKSFPNTSGFEIRFANSFEELGDPTVDKLGKLYMIPAISTVLHDLFEEYIVVHSPSTTEDVYMWEKWGSGQITVDLKDYYTKSEMDQQIQKLEDKIEDELKASVATALDYKGTKDTYEELPTKGNKKGDVWNVVAAHGTTPAGTNYAWDGAAWDPLGGTIDLSGYYTKSQVDGAISAAKTELEAADTALEGQITTVTNQLANKVDKVEGSDLISDTDLNQIRTNKADIANLQTSVGDKQEALTAGDAVEISEANVIDVKIDPVSDNILAKSESGLRVNRARVAGNNIKVGVAITGGAEIGADQTVAEGMKALSDSIKTAVAGGITSITSPDNTIKVTGEGTSRGLAVDMSKLVSTSSSIQVGTDDKLDIFWSEIE